MVTRREVRRLPEKQREADTRDETGSPSQVADQVARIRKLTGPDWLRRIKEFERITSPPAVARLRETLATASKREPSDLRETVSSIQSTTRAFERIDEERAEAREREIQILEELKAIRVELEGERRAREELQKRVKAQERELEQIRYSTGLPGRPGSSHLVTREFSQRVTEGDLEPTLREQARALEKWVKDTHPDAAPITVKTIENKVRVAYRNAKRRS